MEVRDATREGKQEIASTTGWAERKREECSVRNRLRATRTPSARALVSANTEPMQKKMNSGQKIQISLRFLGKVNHLQLGSEFTSSPRKLTF